MSNHTVDPFFTKIGKFLGVPAAKIHLNHSISPGDFMCIGPNPKPTKPIPDLPQIHNYCFTFVIKIEPPRALCTAYRQEYAQLRAQLQALVTAGEWEDVADVALRLSELEVVIRNTCRVRERAITYCIFPDEWFDDPFAGGRTLPPVPPIPPLLRLRKGTP